jgi:hypothetical protein
MMMYSRLGGIEVATTDAVSTTNKFPGEWSLRPWRRPDGRPDVLVSTDWMAMPGPALIRLAKTTLVGEGVGLEMNYAQAFDAISGYLAGTTHPDHPPAKS